MNKRTILIIDDDDDLREGLMEQLALYDEFAIVTATKASEGMAAARDNDVALYDLSEDPDEMVNLADPEHPGYDEALVSTMNAKLNALIDRELGSDPNLVERPLTTFVLAGLKNRGA